MKSDEEVEQLRSALVMRRSDGVRGRAYPKEVRARVLAYVADCRQRRERLDTVAHRLGMSASTIAMWLAAERRGSTPAPRTATTSPGDFAQVKVAAHPRVVLTSPGGWRAEIDLESFAKLVMSQR